MRKNIILILISILLAGCDEYSYHGMNGSESLNKSYEMDLEETYNFYLETYFNTNPPMLDVAQSFDRFGRAGREYVVEKALSTKSRKEFEAGTQAMLVMNAKCTDLERVRLAQQAKLLDVDLVFVFQGCGN